MISSILNLSLIEYNLTNSILLVRLRGFGWVLKYITHCPARYIKNPYITDMDKFFMNSDVIEKTIISTAQNILERNPLIEILGDDTPDLVFKSSDSLVRDLFQCITELKILKNDGDRLPLTGEHLVHLQKDVTRLNDFETGENRIYIIEHKQYCIALLGDNHEVHFYQKFPAVRHSG